MDQPNTIPTIPAKTLVIKNKKPSAWFGIDYNVNIYRGCSHGCIYCDSRSTCYQNPEFDIVKSKENALQIIRDELRRKTVSGVVGSGAMSDPYNPFEKQLLLTRHSLELIHAFGFGAALTTKGPLITRDIDLLCDIKEQAPVIAQMTITNHDDALSRIIEPGVAPSSERFNALASLHEADIFCGVMMGPILPYINDTDDNILGIIKQAKEAGVNFIYPTLGLTLRDGNREYYYQQLNRHFPGIAGQYMTTYGSQYMCTSPRARRLWNLISRECEQAGILCRMSDIIAAYKRGYQYTQLSLF